MALDKRRSGFPVHLYCRLMPLSFIPFIYTQVDKKRKKNSTVISKQRCSTKSVYTQGFQEISGNACKKGESGVNHA